MLTCIHTKTHCCSYFTQQDLLVGALLVYAEKGSVLGAGELDEMRQLANATAVEASTSGRQMRVTHVDLKGRFLMPVSNAQPRAGIICILRLQLLGALPNVLFSILLCFACRIQRHHITLALHYITLR